jgi:photosystem II stability/assembly factor-like uncharacterized protein
MKRHYTYTLLLTTLLLANCDSGPDTVSDMHEEISVDNWTISKSTHGFNINPRSIFFTNAEVGFMAGYNGTIHKTTDAGTTWEKQNSGTSLHLLSTFFLDENTGYTAGQAMNGCLDADCGKGSILLKTIDGGETWNKTFFPDYVSIQSLHFFNELRGLAIVFTPVIPNTRNYFIASTSNGGASWEFINLPIKPTYDKFVVRDNIVYVAGEGQRIFKSNDYGTNWKTVNTPLPASLNIRNLYVVDENTVFIDGITAIYKTTNGGTNWEKLDFPFSSFGMFHFYDKMEGFIIETISVYEGGEFPVFKGSLVHTTHDGGLTWKNSGLINSLRINLSYFPEKGLGYGTGMSDFYTIRKK